MSMSSKDETHFPQIDVYQQNYCLSYLHIAYFVVRRVHRSIPALAVSTMNKRHRGRPLGSTLPTQPDSINSISAHGPIFAETPVKFSDSVEYRISRMYPGYSVQRIVWDEVLLYTEEQGGLYDLSAKLLVAKVKLIKREQRSETLSVETPLDQPLWFLPDGTPFRQYQEGMEGDHRMSEWWTSPEKCEELEAVDAAAGLRKDVDVHRQITSESLLTDGYVQYRGRPLSYFVPVYEKIDENKESGQIVYKHSWTRTLFKFKPYYQVQDRLYRPGDEHVFYRSGRRLMGNPWFNKVSNDIILGPPWNEHEAVTPPKFWHWERTGDGRWSSIPILS